MTEHATMQVRTEVLRFMVMNIPCPSCQALVGTPCRKRDGELFDEELPVLVHTTRVTPVWVIYRIGYQHGRRNEKETTMTIQHEISTTLQQPVGDHYEVAITYCDGIVAIHSHDNALEATTEYGQMLAEAIESTAEHPKARHIRLITLVLHPSETQERIRTIGSGIFPCQHQPSR